MKLFELLFKFAGNTHTALVTEIIGQEANQYTVHPIEQTLLERYGSQVVHVYRANDQRVLFPVTKDEEKAFWGAIGISLHHKLLQVERA